MSQGKDELIAAAVSEVMQGLVSALEDVLRMEPTPPLAVALERFLSTIAAKTSREGHDVPALAVQVWAETQRNVETHAAVSDQYRRIRDTLAELVRRHQASDRLPPDVDPEAAANPLFSLISGYMIQQLLLDPQAYARAASAILFV